MGNSGFSFVKKKNSIEKTPEKQFSATVNSSARNIFEENLPYNRKNQDLDRDQNFLGYDPTEDNKGIPLKLNPKNLQHWTETLHEKDDLTETELTEIKRGYAKRQAGERAKGKKKM